MRPVLGGFVAESLLVGQEVQAEGLLSDYCGNLQIALTPSDPWGATAP